MPLTDQSIDQILVALRRIVRAIDLHSKHLAQQYGLTGPQAVLLRAVLHGGPMHVAELAQSIDLSHATVTDILNRLEKRGLVTRVRSESDRRRVEVRATPEAAALVEQSPPLLQERFTERLGELDDWELTQILSVLQRMAVMMDARQVDASPVLVTGSVTAAVEAELESAVMPEAAPRQADAV